MEHVRKIKNEISQKIVSRNRHIAKMFSKQYLIWSWTQKERGQSAKLFDVGSLPITTSKYNFVDIPITTNQGFYMDEFQRIMWLNKLEQLKQQAEDDNELMFIFGIVYAALEQGQLSRLKEQYSKFADIRIKELEDDLKKLEDQLGDIVIERAQKIISSPYDDFKLGNKHDDYFPFNESGENDQRT